MYYGRMTRELCKLYVEYENKFGVTPDFYIELEYTDATRDIYIADIKRALRGNMEIEDFYLDNEE